jgi:pSer/pThr/pTyr-binding forkhead associated (FHA) protein
LAVPLLALGLLLFSNKRRRAVPAAQSDAKGLARPLLVRTAGEAREGPPQFRLVASQAGATSRVDLNGAVSIGSSPDSDIVFSGDGVARHHARLWVRDGKVMVHHLAVGYETLVAGQPIDWAPLAAGSEVRVGGGTLVIERVPTTLR